SQSLLTGRIGAAYSWTQPIPQPVQPPIEEETMRFPILSRFDRAGPDASSRLVSRRRFFGASAGAAGAVLGSGLWTPAQGDPSRDDDEERKPGTKCPEPDPIPHVTTLGPPGVPIPCAT